MYRRTPCSPRSRKRDKKPLAGGEQHAKKTNGHIGYIKDVLKFKTLAQRRELEARLSLYYRFCTAAVLPYTVFVAARLSSCFAKKKTPLFQIVLGTSYSTHTPLTQNKKRTHMHTQRSTVRSCYPRVPLPACSCAVADSREGTNSGRESGANTKMRDKIRLLKDNQILWGFHAPIRLSDAKPNPLTQ